MPQAEAYSVFITCPYTWLCVRGDVGESDYNWLKGPLFTSCPRSNSLALPRPN
jgi:hypothetical protein